jgi:hypothetical protein
MVETAWREREKGWCGCPGSTLVRRGREGHTV